MRLTLLLLLIVSTAYSQKPPIKFGDIPPADLRMMVYTPDSSAVAVILADYGHTEILLNTNAGVTKDEGLMKFHIMFERIVRIKILKKDGLSFGDFRIPIYKSDDASEKLSGIKGYTYNLEGSKVVETKLNSSNIFYEEYNENITYAKLAFTNVREGSVVELTYKIESPYLANFQDWEFQSTIPTRLSEYRATIPEYYSYEKYMQGYVPLAINESVQNQNSIVLSSIDKSDGMVNQTSISSSNLSFLETKSRWAAINVPAFKTEPYMTTVYDYLSKINFELSYRKFPNSPPISYMGSWAEIGSSYYQYSKFNDQISGNNFMDDKVKEITAGLTNDTDIIEAVNTYVKQHFLWDGNSSKYPRNSIKKVWDNQKGNSSDINFMLASMLKKANIEVLPILISTRDHGFIRESFPNSSQFNYMACYVNQKDKFLLLDATDKFLPTGILPERCLNGKGLVLASTGFFWSKLESPKSKSSCTADLAIQSNGGLKGKIKYDWTGYASNNIRKSYFSQGKEKYVLNSIGGKSWEVTSSEFQNETNLKEAFKEIHEVNMPEQASVSGDVIYLNPNLKFHIDKNPFTLEKREFPVNFGSPFENIFIGKFTIPEGYVVDELPKTKIFLLPNNSAKYTYNISQVGNVINILSSLSINQSIFVSTEYAALKEFYGQVVAKQAEQIVLKRKT